MNESDGEIIIHFLLQMGVMLAVGLIFDKLMRKIHQPAVLGELLGGIILGPTIFGALFPALHKQLFPGLPDTNFVLFIGIALSISALSVITRILMDLELRSFMPNGGE